MSNNSIKYNFKELKISNLMFIRKCFVFVIISYHWRMIVGQKSNDSCVEPSGAKAVNKMTIGLMTLGGTTYSETIIIVTALSIMTHGIMPFSIMPFKHSDIQHNDNQHNKTLISCLVSLW
jgi:hypothetical protein